MKHAKAPANPPLLEEIGQRVRARRQERGLTLRALAAASGLSERFVSDLEAGRANISVLNLAEVGEALQLPLPVLVGGKASSAEPARGPQRGVVALLGLRGAGKSTLGKALAEKLRVPF